MKIMKLPQQHVNIRTCLTNGWRVTTTEKRSKSTRCLRRLGSIGESTFLTTLIMRTRHLTTRVMLHMLSHPIGGVVVCENCKAAKGQQQKVALNLSAMMCNRVPQFRNLPALETLPKCLDDPLDCLQELFEGFFTGHPRYMMQ
mmetsp:Transcript_1170/g.3012  ORF Transcript_1170/g.3012 Transcript_1170/m.3012 type:complete len:143 (+) Transcript_1170:312-740(+)